MIKVIPGNIRWPLINGKAIGDIIFPKGIPAGSYHLWSSVQAKFFRVYGQVLYCNRKLKDLNVKLITDNRSFIQTLPLGKDGSFVIADWLMYDNASLFFSTNNDNDILAIHPECWLDSAYYPAAKAYAQITVSEKDTVVSLPASAPSLQPVAWKGPAAYREYMPEQLYNLYFSTGRFRDTGELLISVMDTGNIKKQKDIKDIVSTISGDYHLNLELRKSGLYYSGKEVNIYWDQLPISFEAILKLQFDDLSIIKLIPAATEKDKMIFAIYSKRYPFTDPKVAQNSFVVKGYSRSPAVLSY